MKAEKVYYEMERLTFEEVKDILVVCTILSTSGGGDLNKELHLAKEDWENNLQYKLFSLEEIKELNVF